MEQLSGLDASFLYLETPDQLMHVCAALVLDPGTVPGGYDFASFKAELGRRISGVPTFRRKLRQIPWEIDHPVWVDDAEFDLDRHIRQVALPAPGGRAELTALVAELAETPLSRRHPLWEMAVIEGLADGRIAVFTKMHHATVDGISGASLISHLCSLEPDAASIAALEGLALPPLPAAPGDLSLLRRGVSHALARPWRLMQMARPTVEVVSRTVRRARAGVAMAAPLTAPRTSFNGTITGHRAVAFADLSLDKVRAIRALVPGATINDVLLAVSGGALRRYLDGRGELPQTSLLATIPVSVHGTSHRAGGTNKVSSLFARLGTNVADPLARLRMLAEADAHAKAHHDEIPADTLGDWAEFSPPHLFGVAMRLAARLRLAERAPVIQNLVISNVPGPPVPLYFVGARIEGFYPLGPVFHGAGLNITVISNNGRLHVGLIGCKHALPAPELLAREFATELDALYTAVAAEPEAVAPGELIGG